MAISLPGQKPNRLLRHGFKEQAIAYFDEMVELGLVGHTLNTHYGDRLMCVCCGCCCSQTLGRIKWDNPNALAPSNFVPKTGEDCVGCETCTDRCFFEALSLDEETDQIRVEPEKCLGCGVCTLACPQETLKLHRLERSTIPFENSIQLDIAQGRENREG
ncbi:MAG: 4Fe-4S dicluster domain-containing protein [Proteobacteria bacterium]|nr:4Fe-4S dicluster domain-containing protein [Pseudomonadota bacterium]